MSVYVRSCACVDVLMYLYYVCLCICMRARASCLVCEFVRMNLCVNVWALMYAVHQLRTRRSSRATSSMPVTRLAARSDAGGCGMGGALVILMAET